jgi:hypothetical protein
MHWKYIIEGVIIICCAISNYNIINTYKNNYLIEQFTIKQLIHQEYRCIRHFDDREHNKYQNEKCKDYLPNYIQFIMQKYRYISIFYLQNFLVIIFIIIIHLL